MNRFSVPALVGALFLVPACGSAVDDDSLSAESKRCSDGDWPVDLPSLTIGGVEGHAINVESLEAEVVLDTASQQTKVRAKLGFQMNFEAGAPIFDLRQTVSALSLDGEEIDISRLVTEDLGDNTGLLSVLDADLESCSRHVLSFQYDIAEPLGSEVLAPVWGDDQDVAWDFALSDTEVASFLEMWFPSNLCHDEFSFALDVSVESAVEHTLITNGEQGESATNEWTLTFPENTVSHSPMLVLLPTRDVVGQSSQLELPLSGTVALELYTRTDTGIDLDAIEEQLKLDMARFEDSTGPYLYDRFTAYVWDQRGGMEYDAATTSSVDAMSHETHHSWFARGARPLTQNDGWIDEAWTMYAVDNEGSEDTEESLGELLVWPRSLSFGDPWSRLTPIDSYFVGSYVFRWFAAAIGRENLVAAMSEFYKAHALGPITTEGLERHLHCTTDVLDVREVFHSLVYNREGAVGSVPAGYCD